MRIILLIFVAICFCVQISCFPIKYSTLRLQSKYTVLKVASGSKENDNGKPREATRIKFDELKSNQVDFLRILRERSTDKFDLSREEQNDLQSLLKHHLPGMNSAHVASAISSAGHLSEKSKSPGKVDQQLMIQNIQRVAAYLSPHDVSILLVSLARFGMSWQAVVTSLGALVTKVEETSPAMSSKSLGDTVWGLGALGATWPKLKSPLRSAILLSLEKESANFANYQLPSVLWGLAKMGVKWSALPVKAQSGLIKVLQEGNPKTLTPQQASKIIWSLGSLGVSIRQLADPFLDIYLGSVNTLKKSKMGFALTSSQTLSGLAKLGVRWDKLGSAHRYIVRDQLLRVCQGSNDQGVANALWAVGSIGMPLDQQPLEYTSVVMASLLRAANSCSAWELTNIIWALSKMNVRWDTLSEEVLRGIIVAAERLGEADAFNPIDVAVLLWGFGELDAPFDSMHRTGFVESLYRSIMQNLPDMKASEVAKLMWGLSSTGLSWDNLPVGLHWQINAALRREGPSMTPHDLANCAYAVALMGFDTQNSADPAFRGVHEVLMKTILRAKKVEEDSGDQTDDDFFRFFSFWDAKEGEFDSIASVEEKEQLKIFLNYLDVMKFEVSGREKIPFSFLAGAAPAVSSPWPFADSSHSMPDNEGTTTTSQLQARALRGLTEALQQDGEAEGKFRVLSESSSFYGVFPVDAAIYYESELMFILEIDGPQHYRFDGQLRRKDKLKECMYQRKHPDCVMRRIRWDEVGKLEYQIIGNEIITHSVMATKSINPVSKAFKSFERSVSEFFSWGMRNERN